MDFWHGKRVFITGHTGFKGSWFAFWLKLLGAEVCGYSLPPEAQPNLFEELRIKNSIDSTFGDIRDLQELSMTIKKFQPELVFHLAAQSLVRRSYKLPVDTYTTNVIGTVNLLEAVRQINSVKAVVVVTTDKVYENKEQDSGYIESDRLGGFDPYSNSKACAELAVSSYRNSFFFDQKTLIATARAGNVIGGGDWSEDRLLPDVFRSLLQNEKLLIRNPNSIRPWQHTLEPLAGYMLLAERLFEGATEFAESWNFGPNEEDSKPVSNLLEKVSDMWEGGLNWEVENGDQPHETKLLTLDNSKAKSKLGWRPKLSLSKGLELTVEWFKSYSENRDLTGVTAQQIEFYQDIA